VLSWAEAAETAKGQRMEGRTGLSSPVADGG
jgi:hypothetical protein